MFRKRVDKLFFFFVVVDINVRKENCVQKTEPNRREKKRRERVCVFFPSLYAWSIEME